MSSSDETTTRDRGRQRIAVTCPDCLKLVRYTQFPNTDPHTSCFCIEPLDVNDVAQTLGLGHLLFDKITDKTLEDIPS